MNAVAAILLAAGRSSRFRAAAGAGGPATKLIAVVDGEPMARRVARAALASKARPILVVTGHAQAEVEAALAGLPVGFAHNPLFATGLASSLKTAVAALPADIDAAIVLLGDMPRVSAALIDGLIDAFDHDPNAKAVAPVRRGERGNPVLVSRNLFGEIARLDGDIGARRLLRAAGADVVEVEIDDDAIAYDVDTPDHLE